MMGRNEKIMTDESLFDSPGHVAFGKATLPGQSEPIVVSLNSGVTLTLGEVIAFAGDYLGDPKQTISQGKTPQERRERFLANYKVMNETSAEAISKIRAMIENEDKLAETAVAHGESEEDALGKTATSDNIAATIYTGGKYITLADHNLDHFSAEALVAFQVGFELAMEAAAAGDLNLALGRGGYAFHFLTDLFASGHIRTPRAALEFKYGDVIGSLLSLFMHNEDGDNGLKLFIEKEGQKIEWQSYGDGHLFEAESKENFERGLEAVQTAINEIHQCFLNKALPTEPSKVMALIPKPTPEGNNSPLFMVENGKLTCRQDLDRFDCKERCKLTKLRVLEVLAHFELKPHYAKSHHQKRISAAKTEIKAAQTVPLQPAVSDQGLFSPPQAASQPVPIVAAPRRSRKKGCCVVS